MSEVTIAKLERQLDDAISARRTLEQLRRLFGNRDFKELILNQFIEKEAARQVRLSVSLQNVQQRADAIASAQAAGHLLSWLNSVEQEAIQKVNDIGSLEADLVHLRAQAENGTALEADAEAPDLTE